ncbi:MAG: SMI1/KNR4 family protein [Lewinellaceae bacterium]|nr:SMI1/KNR4 family protein [Saprospiraceae bacterium]MCB9334459.1 SMI1/KNR4 family protein [Lewinellaceae bacterium]
MKYITEELLQRITQSTTSEGYSFAEIQKAEAEFGIQFPQAYREFLQVMGKRVNFFQGIDYSMYDLKLYKEDAVKYLYSLFGDIGMDFLKEDDIVFVSGQGCNHYYMSTSEGENPSVNFIHEGMRKLEPVETYESFTEFIKQMGNL